MSAGVSHGSEQCPSGTFSRVGQFGVWVRQRGKKEESEEGREDQEVAASFVGGPVRDFGVGHAEPVFEPVGVDSEETVVVVVVAGSEVLEELEDGVAVDGDAGEDGGVGGVADVTVGG